MRAMLSGRLAWLTLAFAVVLAATSALGSASSGDAVRATRARVLPGLIAFARWDGIYVIRADGSGERPLRRDRATAGVVRLAWSPDGRKLAFTNKKGEVWAMGADGSGLVRLVAAADISAKVILGPLTWLPDGRRIAFTAIHQWSAGERAREWDIYLVNADGTDAQRLVRTPRLYEFEVDWSRVGDRVAVTDMSGMFAHLRVMTTTGKILSTANPGWGWEIVMPDWSPDGRRLAFIEWPNFVDGSGSLSDAEIWVTTPSGNWRRLTWNRVVDSNPVWSSDGRKLAFVRERNPATALMLPQKRGAAEIYVMNADGSGISRLTYDDTEEASPAWQPAAAATR